MRRGLAGVILGLSLVLASVAWAGFIMNRTVLDPGRSERLADQLFDNATLRSALVDRLAAGLEAALPDAAPDIPDQLLTAAADRALDDPAVQTLIRDGIVATHRNALEGNVSETQIDATALGSATRAALVEERPELAAVIPAIPPVTITLPTSGLSKLGAIKSFVERATIIIGALALIGGAIALVITSNRPAVLRRVAFWAFGAALFWIAVGYGIPWLANLLAPSSSAIIAAIIDVFFGAMIGPAIALAVIGAGLLAASMLWAGVSARRPATVLQPARGQGRGQAMTDRRPTGGTVSNVRSAPTQARAAAQPRAAQPRASQPSASQPRAAQPSASQPGQPQPRPLHAPPSGPSSAAPSAAVPPTPGPEARWVEGVGYVDGSEDDTPSV